MKPFWFALLFVSLLSAHAMRAAIPGYQLTTVDLDAEIHPRLVAAAPNGNVWFAQETTTPHSIGFFTPSGRVTNFPVPCTKCSTGEEVMWVWDLAADPDGSVWFIDNHARSGGASLDSAIGHLTDSGTFTFFPIPTKNATAIVRDGFGQSSLTLAADGSVWFTENAAGKAGLLTPSTGAFIEYPLEMPEQPSGITIGNDGKVWFTVADHEIAQIIPPSNGAFVEFSLAFGAYPLGLATGPDGNIWLTEAGRHKIGRLQPSGLITEFSLPTNEGTPQHIVTAPDGTLWYTESTGMDIGRVTLDASSTPTFEVLPTPGQQNFDLTVATSPRGGVRVFFTGRNTAGQDQLSVVEPLCTAGPSIRGPLEFTSIGPFHAEISIDGKAPLTVTIAGLPPSWTAQTGTVTKIDSDANPKPGTYTFTISAVDANGCSTSEQIVVHVPGPHRHSVRH